MTAKYRVMIYNPDEKLAIGPLCLSPTVGFTIASKYVEDIQAGRSQDECLAEIKAEFEQSFNEGWSFIEQTMREIGR